MMAPWIFKATPSTISVNVGSCAGVALGSGFFLGDDPFFEAGVRLLTAAGFLTRPEAACLARDLDVLAVVESEVFLRAPSVFLDFVLAAFFVVGAVGRLSKTLGLDLAAFERVTRVVMTVVVGIVLINWEEGWSGWSRKRC